MTQKMNRRAFVKTIGGGVLGLPLISSLLTQLPTKLFGADVPEKDLLKETDAPAKAVNYCPDASHPKTCPAHAKADKKDQKCQGCQFYTKAGEFKGAEVGNCILFNAPKKYVKSNGWCQSFVKKA